MPSRRSFSRSHNGCQNCKTRRVKCDEHFPRCYRCQKRDEECSYSAIQSAGPSGAGAGDAPGSSSSSAAAAHAQALALATAGVGVVVGEHHAGNVQFLQFEPRDFATESSSSHSQSNRPGSSRSPNDLGDEAFTGTSSGGGGAGGGVEWGTEQLDAIDKVLFDHYTTYTYLTLNENEKITVAFFGNIIPRFAQRHALIMHSLLAAAGAHTLSMVSSGQETGFTQREMLPLKERTLYHQDAALAEHSNRVRNMDWQNASQEDCVAICVASLMIHGISMCGWDQARDTSPAKGISAIAAAVEWLRLKAGITAVTQACWQQLRNSELSFFVTDPAAINPFKGDSTWGEPKNAQLRGVHAICSRDEVHSSHQRLFSTVITGLDELYTAVSADPRTMGARWDWIRGRDAQELAELVEARQPEALVVLAQWALTLDPWPGAWWENGFGSALKAEIRQQLPAEYAFAVD